MMFLRSKTMPTLSEYQYRAENATLKQANKKLREALERLRILGDDYISEHGADGGEALEKELLNAKKVLQESKTVV
jgi:hypothetical protein